MYNRNEILNRQDERREARRPNRNKAGFYVMPKQTENTKAELKIHAVLRKDYLNDHPICECGRNGCRRKATTLHHKRGRGIYLNVVETFLALAMVCHTWVNEHNEEALKLGLTELRLSKN